jgi:predicted TPR repeat methyltransferase
MPALLGDTYKSLYSNYYASDVAEKREITAIGTLAHIRELVGPGKFGRVVDVGAGEGALLGALHRDGIADELHALEISPSGIQAIEARGLPVVVSAFDGYRIPYPDQHFDLVVSIHVLEHVEHERLLLREICRVGKRLLIEVPIEGGLRIERNIGQQRVHGHINFYMPRAFLNLLETTGFRVLSHRVLTSTLALEQHCSGRASGWVKHVIRRGMLKALPHLAPYLMTYMMAALCEPAG